MSIASITEQLKNVNLDQNGQQPVSLNLNISENKSNIESDRQISEMKLIVDKIYNELTQGISLINLKQDMLENTMQAQQDIASGTEQEEGKPQTAVKATEESSDMASTIIKAMGLIGVGEIITEIVEIIKSATEKFSDIIDAFKSFVQNIPGVEGLTQSLMGDEESRAGSELNQIPPGTGFAGLPSIETSESLISSAERFEGKSETLNKEELNNFLGQHFKKGFNVNEAWCAAFVNAVLDSQGFKGTNSASAKSFLSYGTSVSLANAVAGDIVVFNRPGANKGHVAFFVKLEGNKMTILGGNQSNKVSKEVRDINQSGHEFLGARRPSDDDLKDSASSVKAPMTKQPTKSEGGFFENLLSPSKWMNFLISPAGAAEEFTQSEKDQYKMGKSQKATKAQPKEKQTTASKASDKKYTGNAQKVYEFLKQKDKTLTDSQIAGIIGSLMGESGKEINPNLSESSGGKGFGIAQWTGTRRNELEKRPDYKTLEGQLDFMWDELSGQTPDKSYKDVIPKLKKTKTPEEAAKLWTEEYEKPNMQLAHMEQRQSSARNFFDKGMDFLGKGLGLSRTAEAEETSKTQKREASALEKFLGFGAETFKGMMKLAGRGPTNPFEKTLNALTGENWDNSMKFMETLLSGEKLDYEVKQSNDGTFQAIDQKTGEVVESFKTENEAQEFVKKVESQGSLGSTLVSSSGAIIEEFANKVSETGKGILPSEGKPTQTLVESSRTNIEGSPTAVLPKSIDKQDSGMTTAILPMNIANREGNKTPVIVPPTPQPAMGGEPYIRNEEATYMQLIYDGYRFSIPS